MKALVVIVALLLGALFTGSGPVSAQARCRQLPPWPSFAQVAPTARSIVLVKVTDSVDGVARKARSIDVLRGGSPSTIDLGGLRPGRSSVDCRGVSGLYARVGDRLVIAFEGKAIGRPGRIDAVAHVGRMRDRRNLSGLERLTSSEAISLNASDADEPEPRRPLDVDPQPERSLIDEVLDGLSGIGRLVRPPQRSVPSDPTEPLWSCGGTGPGFPRSVVAGPSGVEKLDGPVYDGLRSAIETMKSEFRFEPRGDRPHRLPWLLAYEDDGQALFLVRRTGKPQHYSVMSVEREGDRWGFGGYAGECRLRPLITHGMGQSIWRVKDTAALTGEASSLPVEVREQACASGQAATGRIAEPLVEYDKDTISITVPVRRVDADMVNCQGNPWTPFRIELREPIGDRLLLDGGPWPPEQRWPSEPH